MISPVHLMRNTTRKLAVILALTISYFTPLPAAMAQDEKPPTEARL